MVGLISENDFRKVVLLRESRNKVQSTLASISNKSALQVGRKVNFNKRKSLWRNDVNKKGRIINSNSLKRAFNQRELNKGFVNLFRRKIE